MDILSIRSANYSKQDEPLYKRWFEFADTDADGRLTGPDAVKFFSLSQLPRADLKQVWAVADVKRQGFLGFKEFITAMQASAFQPSVFAFLLPGHRGYVNAKGGSCNFFIDMSESLRQCGCR
jgi:hypothetical protein